eukprot:5108810-Pyramimonas_sp.AAC.1
MRGAPIPAWSDLPGQIASRCNCRRNSGPRSLAALTNEFGLAPHHHSPRPLNPFVDAWNLLHFRALAALKPNAPGTCQ